MKACQADPWVVTGKASKIDARMTGRLPGATSPWILRLWIGLLGTGLVTGCGARPALPDQASRQAIEAAVRHYVAASNDGDATGLANLYAEDAMLLPPDHEAIRGRAAIKAFWDQGTDEGLEVTNLAVEVNGNLGWLVGRYHLPATDEEPADSGKYVMCLKRQADGSWKLTADIWNRSSDDEDADDEDTGPAPSIS
jgi:uncharacterized protein (TIGR02246 family)